MDILFELDVWKMDSLSFDLGLWSLSLFFYWEGEDFFGQMVNIFFDEDFSFDFVDIFEVGFLMFGRIDGVLVRVIYEKDQYLMSESLVFLILL